MDKYLNKLLNNPLPSQDDILMTESILGDIRHRLSPLVNSISLQPNRLFGNKGVDYIIFEGIKCYCYDGVSYIESMRMAQCVHYYLTTIKEKTYQYCSDKLKEDGINVATSILGKYLPLDYGEVDKKSVILGFGINIEKVPIKGLEEKRILVKTCNFNKIYTEFDYYYSFTKTD